MSLFHGSNIRTDNLLMLVDPANPKCYTGSGATLRDVVSIGRGVGNWTLNASPTFNSANNGYFTFNGTTQHITSPGRSNTYVGHTGLYTDNLYREGWNLPSDFGLPWTFHLIGAGGGATNPGSGGAGGGGGGYSQISSASPRGLTIAQNTIVYIAVGGNSNAGSSGGNTWVNTSNTVPTTSGALAVGGRSSGSSTGGLGGTGNLGSTTYDGGAGGAGRTSAHGGGGGGSAGPSGSGKNGSGNNTTGYEGGGGGGSNGGSSTAGSAPSLTVGGNGGAGSTGSSGGAGSSVGAGDNAIDGTGAGGGGGFGSGNGGVGAIQYVWLMGVSSNTLTSGTNVGPSGGGGGGGDGSSTGGGAGGSGGGGGGGGGGSAGGTKGLIVLDYGSTNTPYTPATPSSGFSVNAWVNAATAATIRAIVSHSGTPDTNDGWSLTINGSNNLQFSLNAVANYDSGYTVPNSSWTHLAVTVSGTSAIFYANGVQVGTATIGTMTGTPNTFNIARTPSGNFFNGSIGPVIVHRAALSATEITNIYNIYNVRYQ